LCNRSRRPWRYANQLPAQVEDLIVPTKREKPNWGARKIREVLVKRLAEDVRVPAKSTVHAVLDRHGLVKRASKRSRNRAMGTALSAVSAPNGLWCADFKGEFKLGNREYCYPLTVTDQAARFIVACEAMQSTREAGVFEAFVRLFQERGLPDAIRTDNGLPFASPNGLYNLSKVSVWWLRLGIAVGRKNWLFAGSDSGGRRAAGILSLIDTCKLNDVDPEALARRRPCPPRRSSCTTDRRSPAVELEASQLSCGLRRTVTLPAARS